MNNTLANLSIIVISSLLLYGDDIYIKMPNVPKAEQKISQPPEATKDISKPRESTKNIPIPRVPRPAPNLIIDYGNQQTQSIENQTKPLEVEEKKPKYELRKSAPPVTKNYRPIKSDKTTNMVGGINNNNVPAYINAKFKSEDDLIDNLKSAGFIVLSSQNIDQNGNFVSIVYTSEKLQKSASKSNRGFASSLRLVVDKQQNTVTLNNPLYVLKAFMQSDYDEALALETLNSIRDVFEDLKIGQEFMKYANLDKYQFMMGMPTYTDMIDIAKDSDDVLLDKAKKSNKVVYEQVLSNGSIIVGIDLQEKTKKFVELIGYDKSSLLPYPVLIESGQARILAPKYYIALMYPNLSMSNFMKISSTPDEIIKDVDSIFR